MAFIIIAGLFIVNQTVEAVCYQPVQPNLYANCGGMTEAQCISRNEKLQLTYETQLNEYNSCVAQNTQAQKNQICQSQLDAKGGNGKSLYDGGSKFDGCKIVCNSDYYLASSGKCVAKNKIQLEQNLPLNTQHVIVSVPVSTTSIDQENSNKKNSDLDSQNLNTPVISTQKTNSQIQPNLQIQKKSQAGIVVEEKSQDATQKSLELTTSSQSLGSNLDQEIKDNTIVTEGQNENGSDTSWWNRIGGVINKLNPLNWFR